MILGLSWIVPFYPIYAAPARAIRAIHSAGALSAKIAVQYENDDLGRDYVKGLKEGLGDRAEAMIVKELSHELSDPTIDAQIVDFRSSGADVLIQFTQSKFAAQGIRVAAGLNWHPMHILASNAGSIGTTFIPAGADASKGVMTATWERNPADPSQIDHPAVKDFKLFAARYMPSLVGREDRTSEWGNQKIPCLTAWLRPNRPPENAAGRHAHSDSGQRRSIGGVELFQQPIGRICG